jgi:hypothetical protein
MAADLEDLPSLGALYERAHELYDAIVVRQARSGDEVVVEALSLLEACKRRVSDEALFSVNEELDEIATGCIKYLFLDYYLAKVHSQYIRLDGRRSHLLVARELFGDYLQCCKRLEVLHEDEVAAVKAILDEDDDDDEEEQGSRGRKPLSSADQRAQKIAKFRRDKEARERIEALQSLLNVRRGGEGRGEGEGEDEGDREDRVRELSLLQMQHYARDCLDELPLLSQELTMLSHMQTLRAQSEGNGHQHHQGKGDNASLLPNCPPPPPPLADRPGLLVTRTSLGPNGELVMTRETVKASVFTPSMAPPTISIEEFAEQEVHEAQQREAAAAQLRAQHQARPGGDPSRRYAQIVLDGDEDDEQAVERAAFNDRAWDDWKEENQKGSGNKAGKRF